MYPSFAGETKGAFDVAFELCQRSSHHNDLQMHSLEDVAYDLGHSLYIRIKVVRMIS